MKKLSNNINIDIIERDGNIIMLRFIDGIFPPFLLDLKNGSITISDTPINDLLSKYNLNLKIRKGDLQMKLKNTNNPDYLLESVYSDVGFIYVKNINYIEYNGDIHINGDCDFNTSDIKIINNDIEISKVTKIPQLFKNVAINGNFKILDSRLENLENSPSKVNEFNCEFNYLKSLYGASDMEAELFNVEGNNLKTLEFLPNKIKTLNIAHNQIYKWDTVENKIDTIIVDDAMHDFYILNGFGDICNNLIAI